MEFITFKKFNKSLFNEKKSIKYLMFLSSLFFIYMSKLTLDVKTFRRNFTLRYILIN